FGTTAGGGGEFSDFFRMFLAGASAPPAGARGAAAPSSRARSGSAAGGRARATSGTTSIEHLLAGMPSSGFESGRRGETYGPGRAAGPVPAPVEAEAAITLEEALH